MSDMPFRSTRSFLALLSRLRCSLIVSVYMSNRVVLISARDGIASLRSHELLRPMGIALSRDGGRLRLAIASLSSALVFSESPQLVSDFHRPDRPCDGLFLPRAVYYTGNIDGHDATFAQGALHVANTRFSCIARIGEAFGFQPVWQPPFISALLPEDRCHLNGLAACAGELAYATAFNATNTEGGWRETAGTQGIVIDIATGATLASGLCVPHSPRIIDGSLLVAESGQGRVLRLDRTTGAQTMLAELPGFTRGMDALGDVLFVGLSKLREGRSRRLPVEDRSEERGEALICGVAAIERSSGAMIGWLALDDFTEVFDVRVLPGLQDVVLEPPGGLGTMASIDMPGRAFWDTTIDDAHPASG